jgi:hypothetical protein
MEGVTPSYERSKSIDALSGIATDLCRNNEGVVKQVAGGPL